jgi:hypothetical protein
MQEQHLSRMRDGYNVMLNEISGRRHGRNIILFTVDNYICLSFVLVACIFKGFIPKIQSIP